MKYALISDIHGNLPALQGRTPGAEYAIIEPVANAWRITECCVGYDVEAMVCELKNPPCLSRRKFGAGLWFTNCARAGIIIIELKNRHHPTRPAANPKRLVYIDPKTILWLLRQLFLRLLRAGVAVYRQKNCTNAPCGR